ncbi:hypothetical protein EW146_g6477 [Bondarzewia mesenterica]|uniref:DUF6533 domain-containing protein n=1 Tax=Bondarzewia mesenterica TaxID=1095465 RepID=A0A4S4LNK3_9AGAM|nr:hypothetical protein EW146_g6477 [Bondarzewia mesenterica]
MRTPELLMVRISAGGAASSTCDDGVDTNDAEPPAMDPAELEEIIASLKRLNTDQFVNICAFTIFVYDYILTFESEVKYIWKSKWSWAKIAFFATRYPAFVEGVIVIDLQFSLNSSAERCKILFFVTGWMFMFGVVAAEAIIMLRTWAIWHRDKRVGLILLILFVTTFAPACFFVNEFLISLHFIPIKVLDPLTDGRGCFITQSSKIVATAYAYLIGFDTVVVALTLLKAHELKYFFLPHSKLLQTLYRDGTLYYITLLACSVISIVILLAVNVEFVILLVTLQRVLYAILSSRILLHLRQVGEPSEITGASTYEPVIPLRERKPNTNTGRDLHTASVHIDF